MNKLRLTLCILAASLFSLALSASPAAPNRTFVSINGNDANPCTTSLPCRNFQRAHDVVAARGEVVALDSGGFGAVTINKSVTITGDGVHAGITAPAGNGVTIATAGVVVNLRSLTIEGLTTGNNGINFTDGAALHVENCVIDGSGTGIFFQSGPGGAQLFVKDTISRNQLIGVRVAGGNAVASIDHCRFENNSTSGLFVLAAAKATVRNSVASKNGDGFRANGGELNIDSCVSANNLNNGVLAESGGGVRVANSTVTNNTNGLSNNAGTLLSRVTGAGGNVFTNTVEGNGTADIAGDPIGTYIAK
jgi:hypothetical protein